MGLGNKKKKKGKIKMKKFNKIICLLLSILLCVGMFSGCSVKTPTAEELLQGAFGQDEVTSLNAALNADIDVNVDMKAAGIDGLMKMAYLMNMDMLEDEKGNLSVKGDIVYNILGIDGNKKVERYEVAEGDTIVAYNLDDKTGDWTKETLSIEDGTSSITSITDVVNLKNFDKETLTVENVSDFYTVKGVIKSAELKDSFNILNNLIGSKNLISNDIAFNVSLDFDKDSKLIKSISFAMDLENANEEIKETYQKLEFTVLINQINNVNIEIPAYATEGNIEAEN